MKARSRQITGTLPGEFLSPIEECTEATQAHANQHALLVGRCCASLSDRRSPSCRLRERRSKSRLPRFRSLARTLKEPADDCRNSRPRASARCLDRRDVASRPLTFAQNDQDTQRSDRERDRKIVTVAFGVGLNTAQPGNAQNHHVLPNVIRVRAGDVVNFVVSGLHVIRVYDNGVQLKDVKAADSRRVRGQPGTASGVSGELLYRRAGAGDPAARSRRVLRRASTRSARRRRCRRSRRCRSRRTASRAWPS